MRVTPVKTSKIVHGHGTIFDVLDQALPSLENDSVVAVTSKIVAICEGSVVPMGSIDKDTLVEREADLILPSSLSKYGHHFTVIDNTLISMAGIDESNGDGYYVLWPRDTQSSANAIREHLVRKHGLQRLGVIITDSTSQPMRRGTTGIVMAHSGFRSFNNYIGTPDLFDKPFQHIHSNVAGGLAAAAVVVMGEGAEQTPIAVLSEVPFVQFTDGNPSEEELSEMYLKLEDDLFAPFWTAVPWQSGKGGESHKDAADDA